MTQKACGETFKCVLAPYTLDHWQIQLLLKIQMLAGDNQSTTHFVSRTLIFMYYFCIILDNCASESNITSRMTNIDYCLGAYSK